MDSYEEFKEAMQSNDTSLVGVTIRDHLNKVVPAIFAAFDAKIISEKHLFGMIQMNVRACVSCFTNEITTETALTTFFIIYFFEKHEMEKEEREK